VKRSKAREEIVIMYQEYKESTKSFIAWIRSTSEKCSPKLKKIKDNLNAVRICVNSIVSQPDLSRFQGGNVANQFVKGFRAALVKGKRAVELRRTFHSFFSLEKEKEEYKSSSDLSSSNASHLYCIQLLAQCVKKLENWAKRISFHLESSSAESRRCSKKTEEEDIGFVLSSLPLKFSGLEIEEISEDEEEDLTETDDIKEKDRINSKNDQFKDMSFDAIDEQYGTIKLQFLCFCLDLIYLDQYLTETWRKVKKLEISVFAATNVTFLVFQRIKRSDLSLSLIYPSYSNAFTFFTAMGTFFTPLEYAWISSQIKLLMIIMNFFNVFTDSNRSIDFRTASTHIKMRESKEKYASSSLYTEYLNTSPISLSLEGVHTFLKSEVSALYLHMLSGRKQASSPEAYVEQLSSGTILSYFLKEFYDYFEHPKENLTVTLLFMSLIWIRSVEALEDSKTLFLYKTIYLCRSLIHKRFENFLLLSDKLTDIMTILENKDNQEHYEKVKYLRLYLCREQNYFQGAFYTWNILKHNPYVASSFVLSSIYADHRRIGMFYDYTIGYQRLICFLYRVFRDHGFLSEDIPVLTQFLEVFEPCFYPNDPEGKSFPTPLQEKDKEPNSPYLTYYLRSRGVSFKDINKVKKNEVAIPTVGYCHGQDSLMSIHNFSKVLAPMMVSDYSKIQKSNEKIDFNSTSSMESFELMMNETDRELFQSRCLSMDLLGFFVLFYDFFEVLKQEIPFVKAIFDSFRRTKSTTVHITETFLLSYLFRYFDSPVSLRLPEDTSMIQRIADVMKSYFMNKQDDPLLYILPKTNSLREVYFNEFGCSFKDGITEKWRYSSPSSPITDPNEAEYQSLFQEYSSLKANLQTISANGFRVIRKIKSFLRKFPLIGLRYEGCGDNRFSFFHYFLTDDILRQRDMGEWLFVVYGCVAYLSAANQIPSTILILPQVANNGTPWAFDLLTSVSRQEILLKQYEQSYLKHCTTGDTIFHILAKGGHNGLLMYVFHFGIYPIPLNHEGRSFISFVSNLTVQKAFQTYYD
jgi:hypothetical protein